MTEYETDVYAWSLNQGALLRRLAAGERIDRTQLDWENIAEEIEALGRSERRAAASSISDVIENLMLLQALPHDKRERAERVVSIARARMNIERLLADNPSLRESVPVLIADETPTARKLATAALDEFGLRSLVPLDALRYSERQILEDWLPDRGGG